MKKNLIFILKNNFNNVSNFYNYLMQINLKIKIIKVNFYFQKQTKIILVNDFFYKINQFLKSIKKCSIIKNIFSYNNVKCFDYKKIFLKKNIKFQKNFLFIYYFKHFLIIFNNKKKNYVTSILNNYTIFNNIFI